jgi:mono-ADP-ribosyltransferase sirtuin 6
VNFGESLPEEAITGGFAAGDKADLCLALGSSLTVTPAADIPKTVGHRCDLALHFVCGSRGTYVRTHSCLFPPLPPLLPRWRVPHVPSRGRLVIVNLQKTALHKRAALVIHARCDDVMARVMAALSVEVGVRVGGRRVPMSRVTPYAICELQ